MGFKEQERLLSDIKNLRRARREFFSQRFTYCAVHIFFIRCFCFYLFDSFHKDGIEIPSIILL